MAAEKPTHIHYHIDDEFLYINARTMIFIQMIPMYLYTTKFDRFCCIAGKFHDEYRR